MTDEKKEVKTFYCNVAGIEVGLFDFVFKMGMKKERSAEIDGNDWDVNIVMSPQHAKALAKLLNENIKKYEENFGEIIIDPIK